MWGAADPEEVKLTWSEELADFVGEDIRAGLDLMRTAHLEYPPTLFQFVALCRENRIRRAQNTAKLPAPPPADPDLATEMLRRAGAAIGRKKADPRAWARRILDHPERYPYAISREYAREALGIGEPAQAIEDEGEFA